MLLAMIAAVATVAFILVRPRRCYAKDGTTLWTPEEIANARRNVQQYGWAKAELDGILKGCERWMAWSDDEIWSLITGQEVPRGIHVNPNLGCPSCGRDVYKSGNYPWTVSLERPWKLECPSCSEIWPKNDFGAFHESGLSNGGVFRPEKADRSLLFNAEHPDPADPLHTFAVDDGLGYIDGQGERWWFIAYYSHYCTWQDLTTAASLLGRAYLYTGDQAYAHKGALILDRTADVYPDMDISVYSEMDLYNSHGGSGKGRLVGSIWENGKAKTLSAAYDMVYEGMAEDQELVDFLSARATRWKIPADKSSIDAIRENIETGLLREFIKSCRDRRIRGNEGMTQGAMATAGVVLDDPNETPPCLDWVFEPGESRGTGGGHVPAVLIGEVDRDGVGNEASPGYSFGWMSNFRHCVPVIERGQKYRDYDLHRDYPRLLRMYRGPYALTALDTYTPNIGDTGRTGGPGMVQVNLQDAVEDYARFRDPYFARVAYKLNGNSVQGLHTALTDADPEAVQEDIRAVIQHEGGLELENANLNGYGLATFRSGADDARRAAWLYYGRNGGHGHRDRLNFGMYYRGMDILPDLGYPEYADHKWPKRAGWTVNTVSHNTVVVNRRHQDINWIGHCRLFDASDGVGVVEVESANVYPETKDYRRTFAMVDLDDSESYLVDLFRVSGGSEHLLSFHAGEGSVKVEGLSLTAQETGSFAGPDIAFGEHFDGEPDGRYKGSGYSYLYDVSKAGDTPGGWRADWDLVDTWQKRTGDEPVHVRFHALSPAGTTALAHGDPPQNKPGNPRRLRYVVQQNAGRNIDSLFLSVVEPYSGSDSNLASVERVDLGLPDNDLTAAAVRVVSKCGRTDLILSSDDPGTLFDLGDGIQVAARFAVISRKAGKTRSVYLVGCEMAELPEGTLSDLRQDYSGKVIDFHKEEVGPAWIEVEGNLPEGDVLKGSQIRIHNDGVRDACYRIETVSGNRVDLGDTTFIRGLASNEDYSQGYVYDFSAGDSFDIPAVAHLRIAGSGEPEPIRATTTYRWEKA
jgi:oligo-alginate lyase